jgi:hypothetical protein
VHVKQAFKLRLAQMLARWEEPVVIRRAEHCVDFQSRIRVAMRILAIELLVSWRLHLQNKAVQYWLRETNLFVASHHGRVSGYLDKLFEFLSPKLIVISDKEQTKGRTVVQRAPYRDHARGVKMPDGSFRKVLTTRGDGRIRVVVKDGKWDVEKSRTSSPPIQSKESPQP